jgi:transcriptional regulator GlxA family with amidase domain
VVPPTDRLRIRFAPETVQIGVKIPRAALDRVLGRMGYPVGDTPFDVMGAGRPAWAGALRAVVDTVDAHAGASPALAAELERMLLTALVLSQPVRGERLRPRPAGTRGRQAARAATELMERDPAEPLDLAALAKHSGVSVRTLQEGFLELHGRSPTAHLRRLRLERAHERLCRPTPDTTVTDVALASGFTHLGRFAEAYRRHFGQPPSQTLARSRTTAPASRTG